MRGTDKKTKSLFSYVSPDERVPADHPLRLILAVVNEVLEGLSGEFEEMYSHTGRPSIPPEQLIRALLLQAFYTIRSERQLMERIDFDIMFRWFVGLEMDDPVWNPTTFTKNRDRFLSSDLAQKILGGLVTHKKVKPLLSRDHFSVDGTLIDAWASMKSFKPKDGGGGDDGTGEGGRNRERDFRGQKLSNETHASTTDPDARLYRKGNGQESRLCHMGHALMENRNGLAVGGTVTHATGTAEREAALEMVDRQRPGGRRRATLAGDKGYDVAGFVDELRDRRVTPHIAIQGHVTKTGKRRKTRIDARTTRHEGYGISQRKRKLIEEIFGWVKVNAGLCKTKFRGTERVNASFVLGLVAYNLVRLPGLLGAPP